MNIVLLDSASIGEVDLSAIHSLGDFTEYASTEPNQVIERCVKAEVVITNKVKLMRPELDKLPNLKLICIAATGMNNIDLEYASAKGITVKNAANYSTDSVAETTFALALGLIHHTAYFDQYVKSGEYNKSGLFTYHGRPFSELRGKRWGIVGLGNIGRRVAQIADVFGAEVSYYSTSGKNQTLTYPRKQLEQILQESDVVSIHAPLNEETRNLLDYNRLCLMKPNALLINVARGGIVNEVDLAKALQENRLKGAGFDVFEQEPMTADHPFLSPELKDKLILTPHIAWASVEARQRLVEIIAEHISSNSF
jgi:lactate dehydrogenase-like 2-hydroxyacid dehydrogenase